MIGFFIVIAIISTLVVTLNILKLKNGEDNSRIINASCLNSEERFHLISRWGAQY